MGSSCLGAGQPAAPAGTAQCQPELRLFRDACPGGGPVGAPACQAFSEGRSIAVIRATCRWAPVFLSTTQPLSERPPERLVMAQDTGGAIKGAVRADFGDSVRAGREAGKMRQQGRRMWVLLPRGMKPPMPH